MTGLIFCPVVCVSSQIVEVKENLTVCEWFCLLLSLILLFWLALGLINLVLLLWYFGFLHFLAGQSAIQSYWELWLIFLLTKVNNLPSIFQMIWSAYLLFSYLGTYEYFLVLPLFEKNLKLPSRAKVGKKHGNICSYILQLKRKHPVIFTCKHDLVHSKTRDYLSCFTLHILSV